MQLLNLELSNFRSHKDSFLDFTRFDSAVVVGENGVGKSSFAYGVCYCFWGESESIKTSDLVYTGALGMEAAISFRHDDGNLYRVVRGVKVTGVKKKTYTSYLSLLQESPTGNMKDRFGNTYVDVSGNSINDTTKKISYLLGGLTFNTAIHSNFDLQGLSDLFMKAAPAARRRLFEEIINLPMYEKLEKIARAKAKEAKVALQALDIDDTKEAELELKIKDLGLQITLAKKQSNDVQDIIDEISKRKHSLEAVVNSGTSDLIKKKSPLEEELKKNASLIKELDNKIQELNTILADKDNILAQSEALQAKLLALKNTQESRQAYTIAKGERKATAGELSFAESRLKESQTSLANKLKNFATETDALRNKFTLDKDVDLVVWMQTTLETMRAEQDVNKVAIDKVKQEIVTITSNNTDIISKITVLETTKQALVAQIKKIATAGAMCPIFNIACEKLTQEQRDIELKAHEGRLAEIDKELANLKQEKDSVGAAIINLNESLNAKQEMEKTYTRKTLILTNDIASYTKLQAQTDADKAVLQETIDKAQESVAKLDKELDKIDKAIIETGFNPDEYNKLEQEIKQLESGMWQEKKDALITAEASIGELQSRIQEYKERATGLINQIAAVDTEIEAREKEITQAEIDLNTANTVLNTNKTKLDEINTSLSNLAKETGISQTLLNQMREQKNRSLELRRQMQEYGALERLYKKARILIVENCVPRFQEICNEVLEYLEVKIRVRIETVEESQDSKTKENKLTPTFKIIVIDEEGIERDYNTWSGGEKQRINLAIRQALSTLLLNRAGTKMDLIIIDESDSALDDDGKAAMLKLIQANVDGKFGKAAKVVCITHTSDMKDSFPTRITVKKTKKTSYIAEIQ